jgi:pyruvate dehydrogenase E2 component (dihydrolipoamide acetyltransferase)
MAEIAVTAAGRGTPEIVRLPLFRRAMVRAAEKALEAPYFSLRTSADVTGLIELRTALRTAGQTVPSINDFLVRAVGVALRHHPIVNASYLDGEVAQYPRINVGVAISVPGGLVVPAVYDVDVKDAAHVGRDVGRLVEQAQSRSLSRDVIQDVTFTVSNLGMYGIEDFDPLLNPPQAAILGVGTVSQGPTKSIRLSLGCDHRVLTGVEGAEYLQTLCGLLEETGDASEVFWKESA